MRAKVFARISIFLFTAVAIAFTLSYSYSKHITVQYLRVLSIHDNESYNKNKAELYRITSDEVFNKVELNETYVELDYSIINVTCRAVKGFNDFTFAVTFKILGGDTITSLITVKGYHVVDAFREENEE